MGPLDFRWALTQLLDGKAVKRSHWEHSRILLQVPDDHSKMTERYIYQRYDLEDRSALFPWVPSFVDMFAEDWMPA